MHNKALPVLFLFTAVMGFAEARAENAVPEAHKWGHNMIASLVNTAYFACVNSNNQNTDMTQWAIDFRTGCNIAWSSVVYGVTNKYESSFIPEQEQIAGGLNPLTQADQIKAIQAEIVNAKWWINFVGSTSPMVALNSNLTMVGERYQQTKETLKDSGLDETSSEIVGSALFALRNFGFFYIVPPLIKPINFMFFKALPNANSLAERVYAKHPSKVLACAVFSVVSVTYQEVLISIKNLVNQFLPQPATPLSIARFDDCTRCWFGTNLFGKSGPIGSYLYAGRQALLDFWEEPIKGIGDDGEIEL